MAILYIRSQELVNFVTESVYPLTNISPFPPPPGHHDATQFSFVRPQV